MVVEKFKIEEHNETAMPAHQRIFDVLKSDIADTEKVVKRLIDFQIAIPSWALGTGGTRFGRFPGGGEPRSLEE